MFRAVIILVGIVLSAQAGSAQETTWDSPPVSSQLEHDDTIVPIGKGSVFCPYMTDQENEPSYGVLQDGDIINHAPMGSRIPLAPGTYTVVYGSGTKDQMMQKRVRVEEGATTLIKPDWAGLVVDVIDESRTQVRDYYELLRLPDGRSYGIGQGIEQGLDERLRTWILPPGQYKIVKPGGNINDVVNFGTIRIETGELIRTVLVVDHTTGDFLGFGYRPDLRETAGITSNVWQVRSELAGNALLSYYPSAQSGSDSDANFTATVQWLTDGRYESGNHIVPIWVNLEEGLSLNDNNDLTKYIDKAELKFTYIYRLMNLASPYVRFNVESRLFKTRHIFDEPTDYREISGGDTLTVLAADDIKLANQFSPIVLKQGFGINSILIKTLPMNLNLRSGYGARQTYARNAKIYDSDTGILAPVQESKLTGAEFLLLGDVRIGRYFLLDMEFDILMPSSDSDSWIFDGENRLRFNLTSAVSLLLTMEYWRTEDFDETQTRYQTLLRFSKYL